MHAEFTLLNFLFGTFPSMSEDIQKAKRMTFRLYSLGERSGFPQSGELAQLLAGNAFFQNEKTANLIKLCLETSESKSTSAPLNKAFRLFMTARNEIQAPFAGRSDCLQSCVYDVLLCYVSFWGQVFEYYETMYYKPVELRDGTVDTSPANVSFEIGWQITCLFIRDMMLSSAARSVGVASGYDRSMSWFFYPANATSELEEAKALVLTVIGKIRKRGTVLVSAEGMIGHISFSNTMPLIHWVEDKLDRDWSNVARLTQLAEEYFESTSIRLSVNVNPIVEEGVEDALNSSFGPDTSFLDGIESDPNLLLAMTSRSIALNIRPITPALLASPQCDWSGVDMGEFCRDIAEQCRWPEVVNTVSTAGEIGVSVINMSGDVLVSKQSRKSFSAPARLSRSPEHRAILPFTMPTPQGMPHLQPLDSPEDVPKFGGSFMPIRIPELTPTPNKHFQQPLMTPTPLARRARESDVTFFGGDDAPSPVSPAGALIPLPSDIDFDPSPRKMQRVLSRPSVVTTAQVASSTSLTTAVECIVAAARRDLTAKDWSLPAAMGDLLKRGKSLSALYLLVASCQSEPAVSTDQNAQSNGRKRRKSGGSVGGSDRFPVLTDVDLTETELRIVKLAEAAERRSLRSLSLDQRGLFRCLSRVLTLASLATSASVPDAELKSIIAVAADFVSFCCGVQPVIPATDVYAAGLRSALVDMHVAAFEVAKDLGLVDWQSLGLYYNDTALGVLMASNGLFTPNVVSSAPSRARGPQKLIHSHLSVYEKLPQHCLLVCGELVNRWSWQPSSSVWDVLQALRRDFLSRRHGCDEKIVHAVAQAEDVTRLNHFVKQSLLSAGMFLCDVGDRVGANMGVIHTAFDIVRATILLRPELVKGRHIHQIAACALMASSTIFGPPNSVSKISQAAVLMQSDSDAQSIVSKFVLKSIPLTSAGGVDLFSDCSGALVMPNVDGSAPPEFALSGDLGQFYEQIFVSEMRQVLANLKKATARRPQNCYQGDMGPFPEELETHKSLSPFAFVSLSSALALAMQQTLGQSGLQSKFVKYQHFAAAMPLVSPLGVLPCLLPPIEPTENKQFRPSDRCFRWMSDVTICATKAGEYSVLPDL